MAAEAGAAHRGHRAPARGRGRVARARARAAGGLAALAGPRESRADGVVRPLLSVSRQEILQFLAERGIAFRRDATNGDLRFARNRVRRTLARLRETPGGEESLRAMALEIARLGVERRLLESEYEARILPAARIEPGRRPHRRRAARGLAPKSSSASPSSGWPPALPGRASRR